VYSLRAIEMGNLSTEELFISPLASLVIFVVVMIFLEYGSRFFNRMQEVPSLEWKVLELFRGDLLDVLTRREALPRGLGLGGVRSLHMLAAEEDPSMQSRAASAMPLSVRGEASLAARRALRAMAVETPPPDPRSSNDNVGSGGGRAGLADPRASTFREQPRLLSARARPPPRERVLPHHPSPPTACLPPAERASRACEPSVRAEPTRGVDAPRRRAESTRRVDAPGRRAGPTCPREPCPCQRVVHRRHCMGAGPAARLVGARTPPGARLLRSS
jgi:hypothetical protein